MIRRYCAGLGALMFLAASVPVRTLDPGPSDPGPSAPGPRQQSQQPPIFRTDAHFVTVDAYPTRDGKVIEGLTHADFVVEEDGVPQKIESFEFIDRTSASPEATRRDPNTVAESRLLAADARTRAFVVYLDIEHVTVDGARQARLPLVTMLNRMIGDNDLVAMTTSQVPVGALTFGRRTLGMEDLVTRNWKWGTRDSVRNTPLEDEFEQCFPADPNGQEGWVNDGGARRRLAMVLRDRAREEAVLEHLENLTAYLGSLREGRTSVIVFTEGWRLFRGDDGLVGYAGRMAPGCERHLQRFAFVDGQTRLRDIIRRANDNNVVFYLVNPAGLTAFDYAISERVLGTGDITQSPMGQGLVNIRDRQSSLQTLAQNTDGLAVVNTNDLKTGVSKITDALSAYYLLGYYSTNTKFDGRARRIRVRVNQPEVEVAHRRGYTAPSAEERAARAAALANPTAPAGPSMVDTALAGLARLRPTTEVYAHATLTGTRITAVAEMGSTDATRSALAKDAVLEVSAAAPDGSVVASTEVPLPSLTRAAVATLEVSASLGDATVTTKVRAAGSVFEVKTPTARDDGAVLGAPVTYRATPSSRSPLIPVASFQFRRTERVHIELPVAGALTSREARLLSRDGGPVAITIALTEITRDGRAVLAVDGLLAPLAPGDYVFEITATGAAGTDTRHVAIRVTG